MSCSKDKVANNGNPFLPNFPVNLTINLTLPQYSNLQFPSNSVYVNNGVSGIRGVIIFNNGTSYSAFDAACPNQSLSDCSTMTISGTKAICDCDSAEYSLFSGQAPGKEYPMKRYTVQIVNESTIKVYN